LSEEEQTIIALSVFGGYNSKEIGEMLKLNANTVRPKRSRGLEKMFDISDKKCERGT
jgi:DNA-directed RNA polymerase specialized sigma24 family protein